MKRVLIGIATFVFLGSFVMPKTAEAVYIEITNPIFGGVVYSPDATPVPPYSGDPTTWVNVAPTGSVTIGAPTSEGDNQPPGIYGVGVPLAPLGAVPGYNLAFDINFSTYDSSYYDVFAAVITQGDYIWGSSPSLVGGYTWGGVDFPGIEYNFGGWEKQSTVMVTPALDYYLNVVLDTGASGILHPGSDTLYPSWGTFSGFSVEAIPEPTSILLLGVGLIGLAGGGVRKRFKT